MAQPNMAGNHISGFDYLRVAAAFGVVWIHGCDTNSYARSIQTYTSFAVPAFLLMSIFLSQRSCFVHPDTTFMNFMRRRVHRLVPAYLAWSAVYIVLRIIKHQVLGQGMIHFDWLAVIFFGGASYQLWFVPALLLWLVLLAPAMIWLAGRDHLLLAGISISVLGGFGLWAGKIVNPLLHVPAGYEMISYMVGQTGYLVLGIGVWALSEKIKGNDAARKMGIGIGVAAILCPLLWNGFFGCFVVPVYVVGMFLFFLYVNFPLIPWVTRQLAPCAFGIYLSHAIFVEGIQTLAGYMGIGLERFLPTVAVIVFSFAGSALLCLALKQVKATRWLVI